MPRPQPSRGTKARPSRTRVALTLYVADQMPRSALAIQSCMALCERYLPGRVTLDIVDLYRHPEAAKRANIVAVPTLIKSHPRPVRTLIGTLTNPEQVLARLDLAPALAAPRKDPA